MSSRALPAFLSNNGAPSSEEANGNGSSPRPQLTYLPDTHPIFVCARCGTHLALQDELISKSFSGRDGKAYLFHTTLNTVLGKHEDRQLLTGLHTVADLCCRGCTTSVGWAYIKAYEASQKYKEGKYIMERAALCKNNNWTTSGQAGL